MSWRWVYGITSIVGFVTWVSIILCLPETRRIRTPDELGRHLPASFLTALALHAPYRSSSMN